MTLRLIDELFTDNGTRRIGGVFLNHGIASRATAKAQRGLSFSGVYVVPDGELFPIYTTLHAAEGCGFEVRNVESLREQYVLTLRLGVRRLETLHDEALKYADEPTCRVWRLFMFGSAHGFIHGRLNFYQALLVKPDERGASGQPLQPADRYSQSNSVRAGFARFDIFGLIS